MPPQAIERLIEVVRHTAYGSNCATSTSNIAKGSTSRSYNASFERVSSESFHAPIPTIFAKEMSVIGVSEETIPAET